MVEITYDLADADGDDCTVRIHASDDGGATWSLPVKAVSGDVGEGVTPGAGKMITWDPWIDLFHQSGSSYMVRICADDGHVPPGMAFIPEGEYAMGCHEETGNPCYSPYITNLPVHDVYIDAFYIDIFEVTTTLYCAYLNSAHGSHLIEVTDGIVYKAEDSEPYCDTSLSDPNSRIHYDGTFTVTPGKEDHPMTEVSWYGSAAYANWRSVQEGRTPCYDLETWDCDFDAGGYRLPTEAEWEKAARGGEYDPYYIYPWGNTIDGSQANYDGSGDPFESDYPETTPVGYYDGTQTPPGMDMANGYGLYDMPGNMYEWCNDWLDLYENHPYDNPRGWATGFYRMIRSGSWTDDVDDYVLSNAYRAYGSPELCYAFGGFRTAMNAGNVCGESALFEITTDMVSCEYSCTPPTGTVPFTTQMVLSLENLYTFQTRRIAGRINVVLASGSSFSNWKSGWTNVAASSSEVVSWNQNIPALGFVIGKNVFTLQSRDVTPSPYNQSPNPPAGDMDTSVCTVTGIAP